MIGSTLAAASGIIDASRLNSVSPSSGGGNVLLLGVGAAVIGGTSLFGGKGKVSNAVIGGLVIATITNGLGLLGQPSYVNFLVTGAVLLLAAAVDAISRRRRAAGAS
jgi:D-xylose transport system permease protein